MEDVRALPFPPKGLNCRPSRFGALHRLVDFHDFAGAEEIVLYGGGKAELGQGHTRERRTEQPLRTVGSLGGVL